MNKENLKTILLVNLVIISIFLTYSLWTYQPNTATSQADQYIQDIPSINKKELGAIIFPAQLIAHEEKKHYASEQSVLMNPIYKLLEQGEFDDFKDISYKVSKNQFLSFIHAKNSLEFIFSTEIPLEVISGILSINEKNLLAHSFDRMVVNLQPNEENKDELQAFFISYESRKIYSMVLKGVSIQELQKAHEEFVTQASEYSMYKLSDAKAIFLPQEEVKMKQMFYVTSELEKDLFQNILFTDPRYVKQDETESGETYTDGTRLLQISNVTQMLNYENSAVTQRENLTGAPLVQQSIDFVNSHGGWTDSYRLYKVTNAKGEAVFRLYADSSFPVFNMSGMASLRLSWGIEELRSFQRPFFWLFVKKEEDTVVKLPSGKEIMSFLEKKAPEKLLQLQEIGIGYELEPDFGLNGESVIGVKLAPIWYIFESNSYKKIAWDEVKGGSIIGLE